MWTHYLYYSLILLCFSQSFEEVFNTKIGECNLKIESSKNDLGLKKIIISNAESLVSEFGPVNKNKFQVNIINSKNSVKHFPNWASGIAFKSKVFILRDKLSNTVLSHEICHIYQNKIRNSKTFPSWFKEGMAMYFSKDFFDQEVTTLSESVLLDYIIEIDKLGHISKLKGDKNIKVAYQESLYAYQKIINDYSDIVIKEIIHDMNNNVTTFEVAFQKVIGIPLSKFTSKADKEIKESAITSIFFNLPSILIFISSIIITVIFIYIKVRNKKTIKRWEIEEQLELLNEDNSNNIDNN